MRATSVQCALSVVKPSRGAMNKFTILLVFVTIFIPSLVSSARDKSKGGNPVVIMSTSIGDIKIEMYPDKAPETVKNFLSYTNNKFYDGTIYHRVIPGFMIQGGGFTPDMK